MADKLSDVRRALKTGVETALQARQLARTAVTTLDPDAEKTREQLQQAFAEIPIAEQLRGESAAARKSALKALADAEKKSKAPSERRRKSTGRRSKRAG